MSSKITEVIHPTFAQLNPNEHVLCSVILNEVTPVKMFRFFGPIIYQLNYIRYYGHLTEQRFIMEVFPYSFAENLSMKLIMTAAKYSCDNVPYAVGLSQYAQYKLAQAAMNDPNLRVISNYYSDILSVEIINSLRIGKYFKVQRKNQNDLFFIVYRCKTSMNIKDFTLSQLKANFSLANDFCDFFQSLVKKTKQRGD